MSRRKASHASSWRQYRDDLLSRREGEVSFQVVVEETDLWIVAREDLRREASDLVHELRGAIKAYIALHPEFLTSLVPLEAPAGVHPLIRSMIEAGAACRVGPMAAVAGAVAQGVAEGLAPRTPEVLVENGGDLYLVSTTARTVALLSDPASGAGLGLRLAPEDFPVSLCASSARIGRSLSLGRGDLVAVRSPDAATADAAATALGNILKDRRDLGRVTAQAQAWAGIGVDGVFAQMGGDIAVWGKMELQAI
ncbi:MAG: UPF0280 family protein [Desulfovibrionaceae bacterium]